MVLDHFSFAGETSSNPLFLVKFNRIPVLVNDRVLNVLQL